MRRVSWRARVFPTVPGSVTARETATDDMAFLFCPQGGRPELSLSRLNSPPASASVNASATRSSPPPHDSRSAWFASPSLSGFFSPTPRRFIPALLDSLNISDSLNIDVWERPWDALGSDAAPCTRGCSGCTAPRYAAGNNCQQVFFSDQRRRHYLALSADYSELCQLQIWGYCLTPNHVHAIVVPEAETSMAQAFGPAHNDYS